jgi:hypothetical protein
MKKVFFITLILFLMAAAAAMCEQSQDPQYEFDNGAPAKKDVYRKKLQDRVFLMLAWELADEMNLPTDQEDKFLTSMRDHFRKKGEIVHEQAEVMKSLKKNYKKDAKNSPEIQSDLKKLDELREREQTLQNNLNDRLKNILSVEQQAHFTVVWPQVQEKIKKQLLAQKGRRIEQRNGMKGKKPGPAGKQPGTETPPAPPKSED